MTQERIRTVQSRVGDVVPVVLVAWVMVPLLIIGAALDEARILLLFGIVLFFDQLHHVYGLLRAAAK